MTGAGRSVSDVAIADSAVTLTVSPAVAAGETVTVSYALPAAAANRLQDAAGNEAAALTNQAVTNATPGIVLSPTALTVGEGSTADYTVRLNTQPTGDVTVTVSRAAGGSDEVTFDTVAGTEGDQNTLTFTGGETGNWGTPQTVTVSAATDTDTANDSATLNHTAAGGGYASYTASLAVTVTDAGDALAPALSKTIPPTVNGASLVLTYSEALDTGSVPAADDFKVGVNDTLVALADTNPVAIVGSAVTLTLASPVTPGARVTVTYTAGTNPIRDAAMNNAENLGNEAVTNATPGVLLSESSLTLDEGGSGTYTVQLARCRAPTSRSPSPATTLT